MIPGLVEDNQRLSYLECHGRMMRSIVDGDISSNAFSVSAEM
jgi:hypothetical protein